MKIYNFNQFKILEWEETKDIPKANWVEYMDKLYKQIKKEIVPTISPKFKVDYDRGKSIKIHTDNNKDLIISIKISDNKIFYYAKPVKEIEFEFNYSFTDDVEQIVKLITNEFKSDPNGGIYHTNKDTYQYDTDEPSDDINSEDLDINTPITNKPLRRKRSVNINIIKNVLEDAFIIDDIDLKNVSVEELIRRMLIESRK